MISLILSPVAALAPLALPAQDVAQPVARIEADVADAWQLFGDQCSLSGEHLAVSASVVHRGPGGVVFFYRRTGSGWMPQQAVFPTLCWPLELDDPPPCTFGLRVDLVGERALVHSLAGVEPGVGTLGLVHVIEWRGNHWAFTGFIRSPQVPGSLGFGFGDALSQNSTTIAVGGNQYPVDWYFRGRSSCTSRTPRATGSCRRC